MDNLQDLKEIINDVDALVEPCYELHDLWRERVRGWANELNAKMPQTFNSAFCEFYYKELKRRITKLRSISDQMYIMLALDCIVKLAFNAGHELAIQTIGYDGNLFIENAE
jgi:hypothetical protein